MVNFVFYLVVRKPVFPCFCYDFRSSCSFVFGICQFNMNGHFISCHQWNTLNLLKFLLEPAHTHTHAKYVRGKGENLPSCKMLSTFMFALFRIVRTKVLVANMSEPRIQHRHSTTYAMHELYRATFIIYLWAKKLLCTFKNDLSFKFVVTLQVKWMRDEAWNCCGMVERNNWMTKRDVCEFRVNAERFQANMYSQLGGTA